MIYGPEGIYYLSDIGIVGFATIWGITGIGIVGYMFKIIYTKIKEYILGQDYLSNLAFSFAIYIVLTSTTLIVFDSQRMIYLPLLLTIFNMVCVYKEKERNQLIR